MSPSFGMRNWDFFVILKKIVFLQSEFYNEKMMESITLNYNEIGNLKAKQDRLIAEGKMQRPKMTVGFTLEEREMFDNGIPMDVVFEHLTEQSIVEC
jgi:hypothetical protein